MKGQKVYILLHNKHVLLLCKQCKMYALNYTPFDNAVKNTTSIIKTFVHFSVLEKFQLFYNSSTFMPQMNQVRQSQLINECFYEVIQLYEYFSVFNRFLHFKMTNSNHLMSWCRSRVFELVVRQSNLSWLLTFSTILMDTEKLCT